MLKCSWCYRKLSEEEFSVNPKSGAFYKLCDRCRNKAKESSKKYRENNKEYDKEYARREALYSTFKDRFHRNEEIREDDKGYLLVRCKYCNMLYNPTNQSVKSYLYNYDGTNNLY